MGRVHNQPIHTIYLQYHELRVQNALKKAKPPPRSFSLSRLLVPSHGKNTITKQRRTYERMKSKNTQNWEFMMAIKWNHQKQLKPCLRKGVYPSRQEAHVQYTVGLLQIKFINLRYELALIFAGKQHFSFRDHSSTTPPHSSFVLQHTLSSPNHVLQAVGGNPGERASVCVPGGDRALV